MIITIILLTIALLLILDFYISTKQYEETMKPETEFTFNTSDLIILIRSTEYFIKSAKDAEKIMPKELKPTSRTILKQANKTLKKLKAIQTNNNKIFRGEK